jgi:hypothetical protein
MDADRNILVVVLEEEPDLRRVRRALRRRTAHAHVRVVAPARVGFLSWYTTDEHAERADAGERAEQAASELARSPDVEVAADAEAGEADPVLAVQDALAEFPADEIVVVGEDQDDTLESSLHRSGIPITWLGATSPSERDDGLHDTGRGIMSGRSEATPYALVGAVMLVLFAVAALVLLAALLALWLA